MARSEAQKAADKRYAETHRGDYSSWGTYFKTSEIPTINDAIKQSGMSRADFIRWAVAEWKKQH